MYQLIQQIQIILGGRKLMINSTPISQIHLIEQIHSKHKRRLQKITQSKPKPHQYTLSNNFLQILQNRKFNHENWVSFNRNKQKLDLLQKNQKMFNKLIQITVDNGPYSQNKTSTQLVNKKLQDAPFTVERSIQSIQQLENSQNSQASDQSKRYRSTSLHHNYHLQNKRKSKIIDQQNSKIAQRIMEQTGSINHSKDEQEFRKTRQIVRRLRKFDQVRRAINHTKIIQKSENSQIKFRSKTLPPSGPNGSKIMNPKLANDSAQKSELGVKILQDENKGVEDKKNGKQEQQKKNSKQQKRYKTIQSIRQQTQVGSQQFNKIKNSERQQIRNIQLKSKNKISQNS